VRRTGAGVRGAKGFTLIEMVVLIIIMAVMSSVVVPAYSRLKDRAAFQTRIAAVVGFLSEARSRAIELGTPIQVRYDPQSDTFTAQGETTFEAADLPTDVSSTTEAAAVAYQRTLTLPEDCRILDLTAFGPEIVYSNVLSQQETVIYFREDGSCDGLRFTLLRETGDAVTITLWPATGTIDVEAPSP